MMNESALHELPGGWVWTKLDIISKDIYRYPTFYGMEHLTEGIPVIRGEHIKEDGSVSHDWSNYWFVTPELSKKFPRTILELDDMIMSVRGSVGKIGLIDVKLQNAQVSPNCIRISLHKNYCFPKFFLFYFKSFIGQDSIRENINCTTIQTIKASIFSKTLIPLPPFPEQRAIVSKIEQLFNDLDNGIENFKKAQEQLKIYRQAVLKNACEGKLVPTEAELARNEGRDYEPADVLLMRILEERREKWNGKSKYKEPAAPDTSGLPELPKGWVWVTVEQLNPPTRTCAYGVLQPGSDVKSGIPLVRVGDIKDGQINENKMKKISPQIAEKYSRTKLEGGEILITLVGAIGRTAVVPKSLSGANTARAVGVIPLNKHVSPFWINTWFQQAEKIAEMTSKSHEVARKTLNLEDVRTTLIGLPPFAEQYRIVAEVETRLSICNKMEETIAESLEKAESLRQSILKRAFDGKLLNGKELEEVRNAPDWEPAEKLLERIKAEKTNTKAKKKGKK